MAKKIQIRRRDLQVPGQPHKKAPAPVVPKPKKPKVSEREVELKRQRTALNRVKRELRGLDAKAPKNNNPQRYAVLKRNATIAIAYFLNDDGSLNPHTYKWLVPETIDLSSARFGQIIKVPGREGRPQSVLYAYSHVGQQRRYRSGKVEPSVEMLTLTDEMATPAQIKAMGHRVAELGDKLATHRKEYEGHRKLTRAVARKRNRLRSKVGKLSDKVKDLQ
ncbi:hypothetical protein [Lacticaseibacillus sp. 866-1]|uniref:hypothetical protein n=1 Tax=Lacticaseibacillus sp. 866-1 TaxID=2799576 RepID=UPI001941D80F|nr:hypothetical protein [Lacticaseibacillus sp. 866-1]